MLARSAMYTWRHAGKEMGRLSVGAKKNMEIHADNREEIFFAVSILLCRAF